MIDTHCHLTSDVYRGDVNDLIDEARAAGLRGLITVATSPADAAEGATLSEQHPDIWFTAGIHPLYADQPADPADLRALVSHPRCVAWGELGLDNHYEKPARPLQDAALAAQLALIAETPGEKPIVVHCREAFDELLDVFAATGIDPARFVFHCFTAGPAEAQRVIDFGASISFTGVVTFKNAEDVAEAARLVPEDRIMVETDAPYLAPVPHRKVWPNRPALVVHTARHLADLRGADPVDFERTLDANAERFFGITLAERPPALATP